MKWILPVWAAAGLWAGAAPLAAQTPATPSRPQQENRARNSPSEPLSAEQREKLQAATTKMRQEQTALYDKMRTTRLALEELVKADKVDEKAIRAKAAELGEIEADLALLRAHHYQELRDILPAAQFERMKSPPLRIDQQSQTVVPRATPAPGVRPPPPPPSK